MAQKFSIYSSELLIRRDANKLVICLRLALQSPSPFKSVGPRSSDPPPPPSRWSKFLYPIKTRIVLLILLMMLFYLHLIVAPKIQDTLLDYLYSSNSMLYTFLRQSRWYYYKNAVIIGSYLYISAYWVSLDQDPISVKRKFLYPNPVNRKPSDPDPNGSE